MIPWIVGYFVVGYVYSLWFSYRLHAGIFGRDLFLAFLLAIFFPLFLLGEVLELVVDNKRIL